MAENLTVVAKIHSPYEEKFGIPRQSGLAKDVCAEVHMEGIYKNPVAVRGLEAYSHLWLLWGFTESRTEGTRLTVRPPRLGGQKRLGVFATRSPYRPNGIGLSCVRLLQIRHEGDHAPVLVVGGADLLDGTPIYDIKPYLPYTDAHPDASAALCDTHPWQETSVDFPPELLARLPEELRRGAMEVLAQDPRAAYQKKEGMAYGMRFGGYEIKFTVSEETLSVLEVFPHRG